MADTYNRTYNTPPQEPRMKRHHNDNAQSPHCTVDGSDAGW